MAGQIKVAVVSGPLSTNATGSADFTKPGFGTPKACIVILTRDSTDDPNVNAQSKASIGFSDFTSQFCISHQDEDNSAKVDCDAYKSNTSVYILLTIAATVRKAGTASAITDGVRLTNTSGTFDNIATVIMFGGDDLVVSINRTVINSVQDSSVIIPHSGFTDGNDKLIFFIGTDIAGEDNANTGINNAFGVCHAAGTDAGGWTFVQRCMGWASDHNNNDGSPSSIISTDRVLDILTEAASQDWGLEVTGLDHSPAEWTVTTRDNGAGASMEVYSLALDLDDRVAKVGSVDSPLSGASWTPAVALGFIPQYVGLGLTHATVEDTIDDDADAGGLGISSNSGTGEETCHSWYNEDAVITTDTNTLFRSRVIDFRNDDVLTVIQDHSHSSFNDGDWTYIINTENETAARKWFYWVIEETAAVNITLTAETGVYTLVGLDTNTEWGHLIDLILGTYALTGIDVTLNKGFLLDAALGTYLLAASATNLIRTHILIATLGTYVLAGPDTNTEWGHLIDAALGSYTLTGIDVNLKLGFLIDAATGVYTLAGLVTNLIRTHVLVAALGTYVLVGLDTNTEWGHLLTAVLGTYTLTGIDVVLRRGFFLSANTGVYNLVGPATNLIRTYVLVAALGTYVLAAPATNLIRTHILVAVLGTYVLAAPATNLEWGHLLIASLGTYSLVGTATILTRAVNLVVVLGVYAVVGIATGLTVSRTLIASLGIYSLVGVDVDLLESTIENAGQLAPLERLEIDSLTISNSGDDLTVERGF